MKDWLPVVYRTFGFISVLFVVFTFSALSQNRLAAQSDEKRRLVVSMVRPSDLDPVTISRFDTHKRDLLENLFIGLTRFDARRGQVQPALASDWTVSEDGLIWTFNLRHDVRWMQVQNGVVQPVRPVVAGDVVFAIQRACDPNRPSPLNNNLYVIAGCLDIANRFDPWSVDQNTLDQLIGVRAIDEDTVEFRLAYSAAYFLSMTTLAEFRPLPPEFTPPTGLLPFSADVVTSGAFVIAGVETNQINLQANPTWTLGEGNVEEVIVRFDISADQAAVQFNSGALDFARTNVLTASTVRLLEPQATQTHEGNTLWFVGFSFEYPLLANALVRQALALAIDRQTLAAQMSAIGDRSYQAMTRFTPNTVLAAPSFFGVTFDPARAQMLLAEAGFPQCQNFPEPLTLAIENDAVALSAGQFIIQQWRQNLACPETAFILTTAPHPQVLVDTAHATVDTSVTGRYSAWLLTWTADYPDANAWTSDALHCQFGYLRTGRGCDANDMLLDQAGVINDLNSRISTYAQVESNFFGSSGLFPVVPLVVEDNLWIQHNWVNGIAGYGPLQFDRWEVSR